MTSLRDWKVFDKFSQIWSYLVAAFLPHSCMVCDALCGELVCDHCQDQFSPVCHFSSFLGEISECVSVFAYDEYLSLLIQKYKYYGFQELSCFFSDHILKVYPFCPFSNVDFWISVPLFKEKIQKRVFDHVKLLFSEVFLKWGVPFYSDLVQRSKETPPLFSLTKQERQAVLAGVFCIQGDLSFIRGKKIGIVDDILTSGATVREIASLLRANGAREVVVFSLSTGAVSLDKIKA